MLLRWHMKWKRFVDWYSEWSDSDILKNIDKLENFGSGSEIAEVVIELKDDAAERLLKRTMEAGVIFTSKDVISIFEYLILNKEITWSFISYVVGKRSDIPFEDIIEFVEFIPEEKFASLVIRTIKNGHRYNVDQICKIGDYLGEDIMMEILSLSNIHLTRKDMEKLGTYINIDKLYEIDEKQGTNYYAPEPWEIAEAVNSANNALSYLVAARNSLINAENLGGAGFLGHKRFFSVLKYSEIDDAQYKLESAANALRWFGRDLKLIRNGLNFKIGDFITFIDVFTDNWVADCLVQRKIRKAIGQCDDALNRVESIRNELVDMVKKNNEEIEINDFMYKKMHI